MSGIRIAGTGRYVPDFIVDNEDFTKILDTSDEWIQTRTGIQRRHYARGEATWLMGQKAGAIALLDAKVSPEEIDLVIGTTVTPDFYYPSLASLVQEKLGCVNAFAFDVNAACSGYPYALDMARRYLCTGDVNKVLVVNAEVLSQLTNYGDRSTAILFGDGAGACVLERSEGRFSSFLRCDAANGYHVYCKHRRQQIPFYSDTEDTQPFPVEIEGKAVMNGREVYKFATKAMPRAVKGACEKLGVTTQQLDWVIPHQANLRILETAAKNMKISMDKIYVNIEEYSNTSSASVAICLDECIRTGKLRQGDLVCVVGFGAGLTYGACVFEYGVGGAGERV